MTLPGSLRFPVPGLESYFGGKGHASTVRHIINAMPPHDVYIEPFLGRGAVLRTKRPPSVGSYGIEKDATVYHLWSGAIAPGVRVFHGDALTILPTMVAQHIATGLPAARILVYCDPPYRLDSRRNPRPVYHHEFSDEDHSAFLAMVHALPCRVMVSHLPCVQYGTALRHWHSFTFQNPTRHGLQLEQVWCNFPPSPELHEYTYVGANFRQRERIKRQYEILLRRYHALPHSARLAFLAMLEHHQSGEG